MNKHLEVMLGDKVGKYSVILHGDKTVTLTYPYLSANGVVIRRKKKFEGSLAIEISDAINRQTEQLACGWKIMDAVNYIHPQ